MTWRYTYLNLLVLAYKKGKRWWLPSLSYHYQSMRHVDRPKFKLNTSTQCTLKFVSFVNSSRVDSREIVVAATDGICP